MTITLIRNPVASRPPDVSEPSYSLDRPLAGLKVGLRTDHAWRSWRLIAGIWERYLRRDGASPVTVEGGTQAGATGADEKKMIERLAKDVDCAIVGLGTCGSCTTYTIRDAVMVESAAKPVVAMICEEFLVHARHVTANVGHRNLKLCVLPYPLEARPETELTAIADEYYPKVLDLLGVVR